MSLTLALALAGAFLPQAPAQEVPDAQTSTQEAPSFGSQVSVREAPLPLAEPADQARTRLVFGDADQDGLEDAFAIPPEGNLLLLRNRGDGAFEDVTIQCGLTGIEHASFAALADIDKDGRLDLLVGSDVLAVRLFVNQDGRSFADVTQQAGLDLLDPVLHARFVDLDADLLLDLHLTTARADILLHNEGLGRFAPLELPLPDAAPSASDEERSDGQPADGTQHAVAQPSGPAASAAPSTLASLPTRDQPLDPRRASLPAAAPGPARRAHVTGTIAGSSQGLDILINNPPGTQHIGGAGEISICAGSVVDQAGSGCLEASSVPLFGTLYPLGPEFNIDATGKVGVGTSTPLYRLHVIDASGTGVFGQGGTTGVRGEANLAGSGNRYGGYFTSTGGSNNIGVYGTSTIAVYGVGTAYGVLGETNTGSSIGIYGKANHASATTTGVVGEVASPAGTGVLGNHAATAGTAAGVHGVSSSHDTNATAVLGEALSGVAVSYGVRGTTLSTSGTGVRGHALASAGASFGVYGTTASPNGTGVFGDHPQSTGTTAGVHGRTLSTDASSAGVKGEAVSASGSAAGVYGRSDGAGGIGVVGEGAPTSGITYGVKGTTGSLFGTGVWGAGSYGGVFGTSSSSLFQAFGVRGVSTATSGTTRGVWASAASPDGTGVLGEHTATTGDEPGVQGLTSSDDGTGVGVLGRATGTTAAAIGVVGRSDSASGTGVTGGAGPTVYFAVNSGVSGSANEAAPDGAGVVGIATGPTGASSAVYGINQSAQGTGVRGEADADTGTTYGVHGSVASPDGIGVLGEALAALGYADGVRGVAAAGNLGSGVFGIHGAPSLYLPRCGVSGSTDGALGNSIGAGGFNSSGNQDWGVLGLHAGDYGIGVEGQCSSSTGYSIGVRGSSLTGIGVEGEGAAFGVEGRGYGTGASIGVHGVTASTTGTPILGENQDTSSADVVAVRGVSEPRPWYGIGGSFEGGIVGVMGLATVVGEGDRIAGRFDASGGEDTNYGVFATARDSDGFSAAIGVYGACLPSDGWAAVFDGNVWVNGTINKSAVGFKIDHPLDPENKYLYHTGVESPDMKNIYDGVVTLGSRGEAWVELPEWFEALNRDFRYQLTCIGGFAPVYVAEEIAQNRFGIAGGRPGLKVSWLVTGIRKDAYAEKHRMPVEEPKQGRERGLYVSADAFGLGEEKSIGYVLHRKPLLEREALAPKTPSPSPEPAPRGRSEVPTRERKAGGEPGSAGSARPRIVPVPQGARADVGELEGTVSSPEAARGSKRLTERGSEAR